MKGIRRKIAEENDIKLDIPECTYEGECRGTCPRCEWEVQYLEKTLFERMKLGKIATISGLALGLSACGGNFDSQPDDDIMGDMPMLYPYEDVETLPPNSITKIIAIDEDEEVGELAGLVAVDAEFPGGEDALYDFIAKNLKYPQAAKDSNIQGRVFVQFTVDKDGTIINPKVARDIGGGCGEEALRVVKMMPKWKPGESRGTKYRVQCTLPVPFELNKK